MITSRMLVDLTPKVRAMAMAFIDACAQQGITVLIISTFRDYEAQDALYAQGRTKPGKIVTNARGGYSYHNFGVAFDFVPLVYGKPAWKDEKLFKRCGEIGEEIGLEWGGRWHGKLVDLGHMQDPDANLADLRAAHNQGKHHDIT